MNKQEKGLFTEICVDYSDMSVTEETQEEGMFRISVGLSHRSELYEPFPADQLIGCNIAPFC